MMQVARSPLIGCTCISHVYLVKGRGRVGVNGNAHRGRGNPGGNEGSHSGLVIHKRTASVVGRLFRVTVVI